MPISKDRTVKTKHVDEDSRLRAQGHETKVKFRFTSVIAPMRPVKVLGQRPPLWSTGYRTSAQRPRRSATTNQAGIWDWFIRRQQADSATTMIYKSLTTRM